MDRFLRAREVCDALGISTAKYKTLKRAGKFPLAPAPQTVTVQDRYRQSDVESYIRSGHVPESRS